MMKQEVFLEGVKCAGCANKVQERFLAIEGVDSVDIELDNKKALIESQREIDNETLNAALAETKYSVVNA